MNAKIKKKLLLPEVFFDSCQEVKCANWEMQRHLSTKLRQRERGSLHFLISPKSSVGQQRYLYLLLQAMSLLVATLVN